MAGILGICRELHSATGAALRGDNPGARGMRTWSRHYFGVWTAALAAALAVNLASAQAQHRGNVIPGNPGPSGPTPTEGTIPLLTGGISYTEGDVPPSQEEEVQQRLQEVLDQLQRQDEAQRDSQREDRQLEQLLNPIGSGAALGAGFTLGGR
jgi:hypothetical protein